MGKLKEVFCCDCKHYGELITKHQPPGCYHYKNVEIESRSLGYKIYPGDIDSKNKDNKCDLFKRGLFNFVITHRLAKRIKRKKEKGANDKTSRTTNIT